VKIAFLSNINMNPAIRMMAEDFDVYETEGYGNEIGILLNRQSSLFSFKPDFIFVIEDIAELTAHSLEPDRIVDVVNRWFDLFESAISAGNCIYYLSDAYYFSPEYDVVWDKGIKLEIESIWEKRLHECADKNPNVRIFRYRRIIEKVGEAQAFSLKMWYMGKILHSVNFLKLIYEEIKRQVGIFSRIPKKVLLLDLDNTLWGGLAGENDITPIILSEEKTGLVYKNLQRMILLIKEQGVILGIVSKNNEEDAMAIIRNHPHMVLKERDFSVCKINWKPKHENIMEIAGELNLGLDSVVFLDDNPAERKLVRELLPSVIVPEFDAGPENLTTVMQELYHKFFEKTVVTPEDRVKTDLYRSNRLREDMRKQTADYDSYLAGLDIQMIRVNPGKNKARFVQLMNKTNQFNLTTMRVSDQEAEDILKDDAREVFLYRVTDCFGDNGIVSVSIVDYGDEATITEFAMSCRVMGRQIENAVVDEMEKAVKSLRKQVYDGNSITWDY